jgi:hypothetical protein
MLPVGSARALWATSGVCAPRRLSHAYQFADGFGVRFRAGLAANPICRASQVRQIAKFERHAS